MMESPRFFKLAASLSFFIVISGCDYYAGRMSVGRQQLNQGKFAQAEEAFSEATTAAEDGESLYLSLKALAKVYEAQGDAQTAESLRRHAVMVMSHCLEDEMNGLRPCAVRETDLRPQVGG